MLAEQASPGSDGVVGSETVVVRFVDSDPAFREFRDPPLATTIEEPTSIESLVRSVPDFNNQRKRQIPRVFLGEIKNYMLEADGFIAYTAAERSDQLDLRIRDMGVALGQIAAHEVGHTLGLVAHADIVEELGTQLFDQFPLWRTVEDAIAYARGVAEAQGVQFPLPDLEGCELGHNCPMQRHEHAKRYGDGYYVMDSSGPTVKAAMAATFGFKDNTSRTEQLAEWGNFSASYLTLLHPKQ